MSLKRWLLVGLLALVVFAVVASAQDDDDDDSNAPTDGGKVIEDVAEGVDAEDAAGDIADGADDEESDGTNQFGVRAGHYFANYADLKVPAGEQVQIVVAVSSALQNPAYEIHLVAGHIALLDHSRSIQNFSAQVYQRVLEAGETASVKYTVTPDPLLDPMEYAFVVAAYLRNRDDNTTFAVTAFNGTMVVVDPLGYDFKGFFSLVAFFGAIGGGLYYYYTKKIASRPAPRRAAAPVEAGTKADSQYDPDFVDKTHIAYVERASSGRGNSATRRNRSASK